MSKINIRDRNKNIPGKKPNWEYRFEIATVVGKRKQISKSGFKTKKEALEAGAYALAEYNSAGSVFTPSDMSFSDYLDNWFNNYCQTSLKYNTQKRYLQLINLWLKPKLGKYKLKSLTPATLQAFVNDIIKSGYKKSTLTVNFSMFRNILEFGVRNIGVLKENPFNRVVFPKLDDDHRPIKILSSKEFQTILDTYPFGSRFYVPFNLGMYCGLRKSEVFGLTWDNINFKGKALTVEKQLIARESVLSTDSARVKTSWFYAKPKYNSCRTISINDTLIDILRKEQARQKKAEAELGDEYIVYVREYEKDEKGQSLVKLIKKTKKELLPGDERIFIVCLDTDGKMINGNLLVKAIRYINNVLGIDFHFHALRHTHATLLIEKGINPKTVSERLGHKDIAITMNTYMHSSEAAQKEMLAVLENLV